AKRVRRDIAAHEQQIGAEFAHQVELLLGAPKRFLALRLRQSLEIAERLQRADAKPEIAAHARDVARGAVEAGEIVLEDFDGVETCSCDRLELLVEGAANRNRCDRMVHACCSGRYRGPINSESARPCAIHPTWWCRNRRIRDRPGFARTACRCRFGSRSLSHVPRPGTA